MQILIQHRAEISLRSLGKEEQKQIARALNKLTTEDPALLFKSPKLYKLNAGLSDKELYVFRGSPKLRLILSFEGDICTVEDVIDHDRLDRLISKLGQK
jgi:hypothetical protein